MKKNYILDTTILLYDPGALFAFEENNVIIPITVIEEIDRFKNDVNEVGRNARQTSRILDSLRKNGSLASGISLENGGTLFVKITSDKRLQCIPQAYHEKRRDAFILAITMDLKNEQDLPTILLTKDVYLRIKADALGLSVQDYESDKVVVDELYSGYAHCQTSPQNVGLLKEGKSVTIEQTLNPNQYCILMDATDNSTFAYGRFDHGSGMVVPLVMQKQQGYYRISSRNREQTFALDALLNDEIQLVTLVGKAGTGKTLLAIASSIFKTVDENVYSRILVSRPTLPFSKDIGFLPGGVEEKLIPWMYPIADNVELIMRNNPTTRHKVRGFKELIEMGILVIEPLTFIRGRSIHNQYLIVDEAQNLTPHEIKTIITRAGDGTKIVLTGDPYQIDNPYIDFASNGLTYLVEKFKNQKITAHVTLSRGERSPLSEMAANLL